MLPDDVRNSELRPLLPAARPHPTLRREAKFLFNFTLPVFGAHLLEYSLAIASVVTIGHISTTALAGSTLGTMTASVTAFSIIQGAASALDTLLPSAWTSDHPELVGIWSQRMAVVMSILMLPILALWSQSERILLSLRQDPEVAYLASTYLIYLSFGLPAYAFNAICRRYFNAQNLFYIPTKIIIAVSPVNALMSYVLVWKTPNAPNFIGAPIATAISFNLIALFSFIAVLRIGRANDPYANPTKKAWVPWSWRSFEIQGLIEVSYLGLAGVGQTASEWWSWELIALAASQLGPRALAVQSVLLTSASTTYQAPFALSVATAVRIGNLLGVGDAIAAKLACLASLYLALAIAGVTSTIFLVFRHSWSYMFNEDPEVAELVAHILPLVALFQVFDGLSGVTNGILRARGKQGLGALLNISAYYIIGIPLGLFLAFSSAFKMGLYGIWIGLTSSLVYGAFVGCWLALRTDWNDEVQRVRSSLNREHQAVLKHTEEETGQPTH